jgi:hypothetical protein
MNSSFDFVSHVLNSNSTLSKRLIFLTCVLSFGSVISAQSHPLDSLDIVYVDGVPCNSACQSYLAWSRQTLMHGRPAPSQSMKRSANHTAHRPAAAASEEPRISAPVRMTKQTVPIPPEAPRAKIADLPPASSTAPDAGAPQAKKDIPANSSGRSIQEQVLAATAFAEQVTAASASPADKTESITEASNHSESAKPTDDEPAATASSIHADNLAVVILARSEIKSIADLADKDVAIEDKLVGSRDQILAAIAAAGAPTVQLRDGNATAIDRLVGGEAPAAVLTLVSPEAADWFPEIKGFRTFRVPLSSGSAKARL